LDFANSKHFIIEVTSQVQNHLDQLVNRYTDIYTTTSYPQKVCSGLDLTENFSNLAIQENPINVNAAFALLRFSKKKNLVNFTTNSLIFNLPESLAYSTLCRFYS
jgi:hypothetical protein